MLALYSIGIPQACSAIRLFIGNNAARYDLRTILTFNAIASLQNTVNTIMRAKCSRLYVVDYGMFTLNPTPVIAVGRPLVVRGNRWSNVIIRAFGNLVQSLVINCQRFFGPHNIHWTHQTQQPHLFNRILNILLRFPNIRSLKLIQPSNIIIEHFVELDSGEDIMLNRLQALYIDNSAIDELHFD